MKLEKIPYKFIVCKVADTAAINFNADICFFGKTNMEPKPRL